MAHIPIFDHVNLRAICDILGDTHSGLTGSEIGQLLQSCSICDPSPTQTKRIRLFEALSQQQRRDGCGNHVVAFIYAAMNPIRYTRERELFENRRSQLNQVLSFCGLSLGEDGRLRQVTASRTLTEAQERATKLHRDLLARNVHPDVLRFCRAELLQDNYFHAVFEAAKSVADKIREKSGLTGDGAKLVDQAFGFRAGSHPILAFNTLRTETEVGEHRGLMNLSKGLFGTFRNITAHAPKIKWVIKEQDALDMLSLASLLHRRLDGAVRTRP
jgi:uncharacterized protein (TIGR02391 family)